MASSDDPTTTAACRCEGGCERDADAGAELCRSCAASGCTAAPSRGRVERVDGVHDTYPHARWVTWRTYLDGKLLGNATSEAEGWRWITDMVKLEAAAVVECDAEMWSPHDDEASLGVCHDPATHDALCTDGRWHPRCARHVPQVVAAQADRVRERK